MFEWSRSLSWNGMISLSYVISCVTRCWNVTRHKSLSYIQ